MMHSPPFPQAKKKKLGLNSGARRVNGRVIEEPNELQKDVADIKCYMGSL